MAEEQENVEQQSENFEQLTPEQQNNFEYLREQLKFTGLGYEHEGELLEGIQSGKENFSIAHTEKYDGEQLEANLNFGKSETSSNYFYNSTDTRLSTSQETLEHRFYRDYRPTVNEMRNLLSGRAVFKTGLENKEGERYDSWIQLDLTQKNEKGNYPEKKLYPFDLAKEIKKLPIKELHNDGFLENAIINMKKGNLQASTFVLAGQEQQRYIEANPKFKSVNVLANNRKPLGQQNDLAQSKEESNKISESKDSKMTAKVKQGEGEDEAPEVSKVQKRKGRKVSN